MTVFWNNAKKIMNEKELLQADLARKLDIKSYRISKWIRDEIDPQAEYAVKIAQILNTTVEALVTGETSFDPAEMYIRKNPPLRSIVIKLGLHPELIEHFLGYIAGYMAKHGYSDEEETKIAQSTG